MSDQDTLYYELLDALAAGGCPLCRLGRRAAGRSIDALNCEEVNDLGLRHALADRGAAVIGGFHTPVERACLEILLGGAGLLIVCPARGMYKTIPAELRVPLAEGRLLLLSPFDEAERRVTAELAAYRNRFVAALAERVLFIHAAPGGRTEALAREVIGWGKPVYTLKHDANDHLLALGAAPLQPDESRELT